MADEPTQPIPYNPYALTERQLDGLACVVCGADLAAGSVSVPIGEALGAQVFACASHLPAEPMSLGAVRRDLERTIGRLEDALASDDPAVLAAAVKAAEPALKRVHAALDERND